MLLIDKFANNNALSDYNPFIKTLYTVAVLIIAMVFNHPGVNMGLMAISVFLTLGVARIPIKSYAYVFGLSFSFLVIATLVIMLSISKEDVFVASLPFGQYRIGFTLLGIEEGIRAGTRVLATFTATLFLGLTTPAMTLAKVLKKLRVPTLFIELFLLIYRFIMVFITEAVDIVHAQELRFGFYGIKNGIHSTGLVIRLLLTRVLIRFQEMSVCLAIRLYDGDFTVGD